MGEDKKGGNSRASLAGLGIAVVLLVFGLCMLLIRGRGRKTR